jgi:amino acid adenylation domain-containing protein
MFVNTVAIRSDLSGQPTFRELVGRVRESGLGALAHAELPFEKVVELINPPRDRSRSPIFQVLFNAFNMEAPEEIRLPGLRVSAPDVDELLSWIDVESKFDLTMYSRETGDGLQLLLVHNADLFGGDRMEVLLGHFCRFLQAVADDPDVRIGDIDLLTDTERLSALSAQVMPDPVVVQGIAHHVVSRFSETASRCGERVAVKGGRSQCSYRELDELSDGVAALLLDTGNTSTSDRIGVLCEPEPALFAALLGVLKAGRSFVPLDPVNPPERLGQMVADAGIEMIIADQANAELASRFEGCSLKFVEELDVAQGGQHPPLASSDAEAYVLYTSGSTGTPKGVVQSYANLLRHADIYARSIAIDENDRLSLVSSYGFDAALMDIFGALLNGATLVPMDLQQRGVHRLRDGLLEEEITVYHSTPTVFRAFMGFSEGDEFASVRAVVLGGEAVHRSDVDAFRERFPRGAELLNLFGASESSIALLYRVDHDTRLDQGSIPVGHPVDGTEVVLLDEEGRPTSVIGEIAIQSRQVALGYVGLPQLTEQSFLEAADDPKARVYRTGDLARRRPDGALVFLGRRDDQIKLRGYRVELGDIESTLTEHDSVSRAVVRVDGEEGAEYLVAFVTAPDSVEIEPQVLKLYLIDRVPSYMVPVRIEVLPELPLTATGKVDRARLPEVSIEPAELEGNIPPRDAIEEALAAIWKEVLRRSNFGVHEDFFELGGNSLQATQAVSRVERVLGRELPLRDFFAAPTIAGVAESIRTGAFDPSDRPDLKPVPRNDRLPLSSSQERMWFVQQLNPGTTAYNMSSAAWLDGILDESAFERAWSSIVTRHESLRTQIITSDGIPFQSIAEPTIFHVEWTDLSEVPEEERQSEARRLAFLAAARPFDLENDCPVRVLMVRVAEDSHLLALVMHHAVGDLWSMAVLGRELIVRYNAFRSGRTLEAPPLAIQYADYAVWQRSCLTGAQCAEEITYWRQQLAGIQPLSLPTDRPRTINMSARGGRVLTELPGGLLDDLRAVANREGVTAFMLLLAVFQALLSRYTGMTDISVGVPIANRTHVDIEPLVGTFVNTLVLRSDLSGDPTFVELLKRVREVALDAYAHQHLPFEKLVTEMDPERDMSRAPLVQVMFNLAHAPIGGQGLDGLTARMESVHNQGAQFELTISMNLEPPGGINLIYNQDLFDPATADQLSAHFVTLLEEVVGRPVKRLSELKILSDDERMTQLETWNKTAAEYPRDATYIALFEERVRCDPDRVAVESGDERLTYGMLDLRAEEVATVLRARAVGPGERVAILMDRGLEMMVSLLAVMKSGAAYVPLDPAYPAGRLDYVLEDSGAAVVLTLRKHAEMIPESTAATVCVDEPGGHVGETGSTDCQIAPPAGPEDAAYVIYTSGSTGKPKGVVVPNRALVNFLSTMAERPGFSAEDVLAAVTTVSFDIAGLELYLPLMVGGRVALLKQEETEDPYRLAECLTRVGATVMQATPATWRMLIESGWQGAPGLKALCGGEGLPQDLLTSLFPLVGELWNMYGPTETTIWSTIERIADAQAAPLIGTPIGNTKIYILDRDGRPVPVGVLGEIYIGGDGVVIGYHERPDLTAERFLPDPFDESGSSRMYRTGDLGRFRRDGHIEHLGRIDHQVKIRGYRIELGEIESVLASHAAVKEAVVVVRGDRLVAYVVYESGQYLTVTEVRNFLSADLPSYMIPAIVVAMDALPLTPNEKIDRNSLPDPFEQGAVAEREYVEPATEMARLVAEVWSELLGVERVGTHDNFFDLGGHSLLAMQVVARVEKRVRWRIDPRSMFFQTLEQIVGDADVSS